MADNSPYQMRGAWYMGSEQEVMPNNCYHPECPHRPSPHARHLPDDWKPEDK